MSDAVDLIAALGGEVVTYTPHGGVAKTFKAVVERQPSQVQTSAGGAYPVNQMEVTFPNDATNGVTMVQERKDIMTFKRKLSDSQATEFTVQKLIQEDAGLTASDGGMFRVLVQS